MKQNRRERKEYWLLMNYYGQDSIYKEDPKVKESTHVVEIKSGEQVYLKEDVDRLIYLIKNKLAEVQYSKSYHEELKDTIEALEKWNYE